VLSDELPERICLHDKKEVPRRIKFSVQSSKILQTILRSILLRSMQKESYIL
jgi:hypothetical protein